MSHLIFVGQNMQCPIAFAIPFKYLRNSISEIFINFVKKTMSEREDYLLRKITNTVKEKDSSAEIILYGSRARGTAHPESDWDLLILLNSGKVSRKTEQEFRHALIDIELETGEAISTFVFSKSDWENLYNITSLYESIKNEGIHLNERY